jgi:hypothetical protein
MYVQLYGPALNFAFLTNSTSWYLIKFCRNDITVRFVDENNKELGRDYFVSPSGQCTVSGYGNIKTITPRGGNNVYLVATCDLCGKMVGGSLTSTQMPISGQVTDCFWGVSKLCRTRCMQRRATTNNWSTGTVSMERHSGCSTPHIVYITRSNVIDLCFQLVTHHSRCKKDCLRTNSVTSYKECRYYLI